MYALEAVIDKFAVFQSGTAGIGRWITAKTDPVVLGRLRELDARPVSMVELNQLLGLAHEAPVSDGFFAYYWLRCPSHSYDVTKIRPFEQAWTTADNRGRVVSLDHLHWGIYRLFVDGLLYFGSVRSAFRSLRNRSFTELDRFFSGQRFDTASLKARGPGLPLQSIAKDDRYLISELACKSLDATAVSRGALGNALLEAFHQHQQSGGGRISIRALLNIDGVAHKYIDQNQQRLFSDEETFDSEVSTTEEVVEKYQQLAKRFLAARKAALGNTDLYLSMVNELDVYVATSMRSRANFRQMADTCEFIFSHQQLKDLHLRYFDPTMSAAEGHEDKGLIECLMVKCAKALVYCAGEKESYGKDAEAAMALSLGKPVIFMCDESQRMQFYREVHPLSRLINFRTGVAVGAMVTDDRTKVVQLLGRLFENRMVYYLEQHPSRPGYLRLKEEITESIVRLHTNDRLLVETFWNHYNLEPSDRPIIAHFGV